MNIHLMQAVNKLAPNSQFTIKNDDYSTIIWHKLEGEAPTQKEVDAAIEQLKSDEAEAATAKAALLDRLGITADEAKLLLS